MKRLAILTAFFLASCGPFFDSGGFDRQESGGGGGAGDITDVWDCTTGSCQSMAPADGSLLDFSNVNSSVVNEGLHLPQSTDCTAAVAEGQICWDSDNDQLSIGEAVATTAIIFEGTASVIDQDLSADSTSAAFAAAALTTATVGTAGLHLLDTNASHDMVVTVGSDLTADRVLTLTTGDAAATLAVEGVAAVIDQDLSADTTSAAFALATFANGGAHILDTNASHDLALTCGSDLTADRALTFVTGDAAATIGIEGVASVIDQDLSADTTTAAFALATFDNGGVHIEDTNASHDLALTVGSDLTADRALTFTTGDAAAGISIEGSSSVIDQDLSADSATAALVKLTINGGVGVDGLHLDSGTLQCDENADFGAGVDVTGALTVSTTSQLVGNVDAQTLIYDSTGPLNMGEAKASGHSLATGDVIFGDKTEFDGTSYFDGVQFWYQTNGEQIRFYNGANIFGSMGSYNDDGFHIGVRGNVANYLNYNFIFTTSANRTKDHDHDAQSVGPHIIWHSVTDVNTNNTQWGGVYHDTNNNVFDSGTGDFLFEGTIKTEVPTADAPAEPHACDATHAGVIVAIDDTNSGAFDQPCICLNNNGGAGYDWRQLSDVAGTACPFF